MEKTNNMYAQPKFKCGICGKIYDDIKSRSTCEAACLKKQEEEAKKVAEAKKKAERADRHAKVTSLIDTAYAALKDYEKDYGPFSYTGERHDVINFIKWLDYFLG